jgi:regulator of sirC expression with transglutaminase-like and TPR domain
MDPTAAFAALVGAGHERFELDEASWLIAAHADPALDIEAQRTRLDDLAGQCPEPTLAGIGRLLFRDLGFVGNTDDYYDPANSLLPTVIDRRLGIPISLSVLFLGIARRLQVPADPVAMPGHFLVRDRVDRSVFVDPFAGGVVLDEAACRARFAAVHGSAAGFDRAFLEPTPPVPVVRRQLANLDAIYRQRRRRHDLVWVRTLRTLLPDAEADDELALAETLAALGRYRQAASIHDALAGEGRDDSLKTARRLRARLN